MPSSAISFWNITMHGDECECARQGLVPEKKVFEVHIEQGHKHGAKVVLRGGGRLQRPQRAAGRRRVRAGAAAAQAVQARLQ